MIKKVFLILIIQKILLQPLWMYGEPKTFDDCLKELLGCVPDTVSMEDVRRELKTNFIPECQKFKKCAFSYSKKKNKKYCANIFLNEIREKCLLKIEELKKDNKEEICKTIYDINKDMINYFNNKFFLPKKRKKYKGKIKYYEFPFFRNNEILENGGILECWLDDLNKGVDSECYNENSFFYFYELNNKKIVIENKNGLCVKGKDYPYLDTCDYDDELGQYDIFIYNKKNGGYTDGLEDGTFIENFGSFITVIVDKQY